MVNISPQPSLSHTVSPLSPAWLLSHYEDSKWIVTDGPNNRNEPNTAILDFNYRLPGGTLLTSPENADLLAVVKRYSFLMREHERSTLETAATHYSQVRSLFTLLSWMELHGLTSFSDFTPTDVTKYVLDAKYGISSTLHLKRRISELEAAGVDLADHRQIRELLCLSKSISISTEIEERHAPTSERAAIRHMPLLRSLLPLEELWLWRDEIGPGAMQFRPFEVSASATAAKHCSITNRTKTIPDRQAMVLLEGCLRTVLDLGPTIISLHKEVRKIVASGAAKNRRSKRLKKLMFERPADFDALRQKLGINFDDRLGPAPMVDTAVSLLLNMCFILIAAFSARRHKEVLGIEAGCIRGNARDGLWIYSAILKNERQRQHTPVPEVVEHVVLLLSDLSQEAREVSGEQKLFQWCQTKTAKYPRAVSFEPTSLDDVARLCGVPPYEGEEWHFTPRQFRRFFAIIYMWRYHHADLSALKHHLRHWDFQTTREYASDPQIGRIFTEEQREMTRQIVVGAATGERRVGGAGGIRIRNMVDRAKKRLAHRMTPMTIDRLIPWAERLASKVFLKTNPWSYCMAPPSLIGAKEANCRKGNLGPNDKGADLASARPEVCSGCKYNMTDPIFTPFLETEVKHTRAVLQDRRYAGTLLAAVAQKRLDVIEPYLAQQASLSEGEL